MGFFGARSSSANSEEARKELFTPDRLIVCDGNISNWILEKDDPLYGNVWDEAKSCLGKIAAGSLDRQADTVKWDDIVSSTGFTIEFSTELSPDLLKWFAGKPDSKAAVPPVMKMKIVPSSVDEASSDVYLCDKDNNAVEYKVNDYVRPKSFDDMLATLEDPKNTRYRAYYTIRDSKFANKRPDLDVNPDILNLISGPRYWPYYEVKSAIPARMEKSQSDELANVLLGNEKDRYEKNTYQDDRTEFINSENIYKVYNDGYLTYSYTLNVSQSSKGKIGDAVANAYAFIKRVMRLTNTKADIYLTSADDSNPSFYRLKFDYRMDGLPVYFDLPARGSQGDKVTSAITIDVNKNQVLKCGWMLRDFTQGDKKQFDDRFLDNAAVYGKKMTDLKIQDISVGYLIGSDSSQTILPSMVLEQKNGLGRKGFTLISEKGAE